MSVLRVGLVGCGGRGTGAAHNCVTSAPNVALVAMGEIFPDRLQRSRLNLAKLKIEVPDENCFTGFDSFERVIDAGVDLVLLCTPPGFRPQHFEARR